MLSSQTPIYYKFVKFDEGVKYQTGKQQQLRWCHLLHCCSTRWSVRKWRRRKLINFPRKDALSNQRSLRVSSRQLKFRSCGTGSPFINPVACLFWVALHVEENGRLLHRHWEISLPSARAFRVVWVNPRPIKALDSTTAEIILEILLVVGYRHYKPCYYELVFRLL